MRDIYEKIAWQVTNWQGQKIDERHHSKHYWQKFRDSCFNFQWTHPTLKDPHEKSTINIQVLKGPIDKKVPNHMNTTIKWKMDNLIQFTWFLIVNIQSLNRKIFATKFVLTVLLTLCCTQLLLQWCWVSKTDYITMTECYDFAISDRCTLRSKKRAEISNFLLNELNFMSLRVILYVNLQSFLLY